MALILIVDDCRELRDLVSHLFREAGHSVQCANAGEDALKMVAERQPDLVLLDLHLGGIDGFETLQRLRAVVPSLPIVMLTAFGNVPAAVKAMKLGATDFIGKPFDNRELMSTVETLLAMRREARGGASGLVGESPVFLKSLELALRFAVPDINILILGETGTGKEFFAHTIHAASKRRDGPFVAVDCSMLAENLIESELFGHEKGAFTGAFTTRIGRFELAQGGTIFLDEIGNLPVEFQAKLLRVLQERCMERVGGRKNIRLDVRVISATNVNPKGAIQAGTFRQDLYYRLQGMSICLPPLRDRGHDIRLLAEHLLERFARSFDSDVRSFSPGAMAVLEGYAWPGNVRELENVVKSAVVMATDEVRPEHLPEEIRAASSSEPAVAALSENDGGERRFKLEIEVELGAAEIDLKALTAQAAELAERSLLQEMLRHGRMSGSQMAKTLGVDPKTLRGKLRRYGLDPRSLADSEPPQREIHGGRSLP